MTFCHPLRLMALFVLAAGLSALVFAYTLAAGEDLDCVLPLLSPPDSIRH
jgi:hypothetical protein